MQKCSAYSRSPDELKVFNHTELIVMTIFTNLETQIIKLMKVTWQSKSDTEQYLQLLQCLLFAKCLSRRYIWQTDLHFPLALLYFAYGLPSLGCELTPPFPQFNQPPATVPNVFCYKAVDINTINELIVHSLTKLLIAYFQYWLTKETQTTKPNQNDQTKPTKQKRHILLFLTPGGGIGVPKKIKLT